MSKPIIKANLKGSDRVELIYNDRTVEMTITDFFNSLPASTLVISNTPSPATSGIYSGSGYLPGNITVNGLAGYTIYFKAIDEFKIFANKFLLENGECTFTSGDYEGTINIDTLTDNQTYTLPNHSGEIQVGPAVKRYKALLSQNAPIASTSNVSMVAGQIWTLETYSGLDAIDPFNDLELISGTIRVAGSKYRSSIDASYAFTTTEMSYDGSPYVVSTDVNGDFNPFINTLGGNPVFSYQGVGTFSLTLSGVFLLNKVSILYGFIEGGYAKLYPRTDDYIVIYTYNMSDVLDEDRLKYAAIEIEVYP